ncbi:hypothetical protein [Simkania sp.]|uniref:hypothetical protein n=1 Tax=Simkania sp. TaxID=34094 RepID=UPI003B527569
MSTVLLANLPNTFQERIKPRLENPTTIVHPRTGEREEKTFFDALTYGVDFKFREVVWNAQVAGDANKTFVRLSSENTVHISLFEQDKGKIRHCTLIASPEETVEEPLPEDFDCYPSTCSHPFFFAEVILDGECQDPASPERIPKTVHAVATEWINQYSPTKKYLIPLQKYEAAKTSEFDPLTQKVDDEVFKKIFKLLGILAVVYVVSRVITQLFLQKLPAPVPPDAPPAILDSVVTS